VKRMGASVGMIRFACFIMLFMSGGSSLAMAENPPVTAEQAIAAARHNAKPGSSVTILQKIIANADTQRIGDQAVEQAHAHKIEIYENGLLINILRSGGYLLAEIDPRTNNMVATHLVLMEAGGAVKDERRECHGVVKRADAAELVKDTAELVKRLYSTPSTDESSLASRFYDGNFPKGNEQPDSLFTIPDFLRKTSASPDEVRETAALFWGYAFWPARYALSMPAYAASPAAAENAAQTQRDAFQAQFFQRNNIDPNINPIDFDNIQGATQLRERIELLTRLNRFLEDSFRRVADPVVVEANISILTMPVSIDVDLNQADQYVSSSPPKSLFLWHRIATGGFAVKEITWDW
jgi:hypothetical protein